MFIFTVLGFLAQVCVISVVVAGVISCTFLPQSSIAVISDDRPSGAELSVSINDSDATLSCASSYCAKSMTSSAYTTTIDELVVSPPDYSTMTIRELKALCKEYQLKRYSYLRKHELIELLQH